MTAIFSDCEEVAVGLPDRRRRTGGRLERPVETGGDPSDVGFGCALAVDREDPDLRVLRIHRWVTETDECNQ